MKARWFHAASAMVALVAAVVLTLPTAASADDEKEYSTSAGELRRYKQVLRAQSLYEDVLRLKVARGLGVTGAAVRGVDGYETAGPYTAPLPGTPSPSYLWGGIDVIAVIKRYDRSIGTDPGGVVFIDRDGDELGSKGDDPVVWDVEVYPGGPTIPALFHNPANLATFLEMTADGSLIVTFGLNCQWGIISGPHSAATGGTRGSHWAQPGLAAINVERFFGGRVTVLGMNFYLRGDDWNAVKRDRWKYAVEAFENLLNDPLSWRAKRERTELPILEVHD